MSSTEPEQAPVPQKMTPPQYFPDPCGIRKPLAFLFSILSPIPGLEAIVWKCNVWGRVVAVTALLKLLFFIIGLILIYNGITPSRTKYNTSPKTVIAGLYMLIVYGILSLAQVIFTALAWANRTDESLYVREREIQYNAQQRLMSRLKYSNLKDV